MRSISKAAITLVVLAAPIGLVAVLGAALRAAAHSQPGQQSMFSPLLPAYPEPGTWSTFKSQPYSKPARAAIVGPAQGTPTATASVTPCTGWSVVPSPNVGTVASQLYGVSAITSNDVWAVGFYVSDSQRQQTLTEHWDGNAWSVVTSPNVGPSSNVLHKVASLAFNDIWAVGFSVDNTTGQPRTLTEHWDGTAWSVVTSPNQGAGANNLYGVAMIGPNDVWAIGDSAQTLILHWDGASWSIVPSPNPGAGNNHLRSVTAVATNDIWATGESCTASPCNASLPLMEHWDGSTWSVVATPNTGLARNVFSGAVARSSNDAWAVGGGCPTGPCSTFQSLIEHWDGTAWSIVPSPNPGSVFTGYFAVVAPAANEAWATGTSSNDGSIFSNPTIHWDGTSWTYVPVPNAGTVDNDSRALAAISPTDVWAVGDSDGGSGEKTQIQHYTGPCGGTPTAVAASATPTRLTTVTPQATPTSCPIQFTDVPAGSTFYPFIRCLACRGIISGYQDNTFKPNNNVTRGQLSKIVTNAARFSDPQPTQMFEDVPVGSTFQVYVGRLASRGFISGYACGETNEPCVPPGNRPYFRPNNNATRGEIAKIDANAAGFNDPPVGQSFEDIPAGSTFYTYTQRLSSRSIIQGYSCGGVGEPCVPPGNRPYFRPNNNATRGQTSKIVANTFLLDCQTPERVRK
jgi:hypothetical protein